MPPRAIGQDERLDGFAWKSGVGNDVLDSAFGAGDLDRGEDLAAVAAPRAVKGRPGDQLGTERSGPVGARAGIGL